MIADRYKTEPVPYGDSCYREDCDCPDCTAPSAREVLAEQRKAAGTPPRRTLPQNRYVLDREPMPANAPRWWRPLYLVRDTWTSDNEIVERFWRSGEAWRYASDLNYGLKVR